MGRPSVIRALPVGFFISAWRVRSLWAVCEQSFFPQLPKTFHTQLSDLKLYRSKSQIWTSPLCLLSYRSIVVQAASIGRGRRKVFCRSILFFQAFWTAATPPPLNPPAHTPHTLQILACVCSCFHGEGKLTPSALTPLTPPTPLCLDLDLQYMCVFVSVSESTVFWGHRATQGYFTELLTMAQYNFIVHATILCPYHQLRLDMILYVVPHYQSR